MEDGLQEQTCDQCSDETVLRTYGYPPHDPQKWVCGKCYADLERIRATSLLTRAIGTLTSTDEDVRSTGAAVGALMAVREQILRGDMP